MPYDYTPSPVYTTPVELASDGDPAASATIMGPIEAALDNIAAIWELGPKTIRHVPSLAALIALTGMVDGEVALVMSDTAGGYPGTTLGLWRYLLGHTADTPSPWEQTAGDASGCWQWIDFARVGASYGLAVLRGGRQLLIDEGSGPATTADALAIEGTGVGEVHTGGQIRVKELGQLRVLREDGGDPAGGGILQIECGGGVFDATKGLHVTSGGGAHVDSGGVLRVHSGGSLLHEGTATLAAGSTTTLEGTATLAVGSSTTLEGSLLVAEGGYIELVDRIRHSVVVWTDAELAGPAITVWPETADEHILGSTPAAPTTIALEPPAAVGQRVRFSRTSRTATGTHLTVTASGQSYILSGGGGDLMWLELVSAYSGPTLVWFPSQYAVH